MTQLARAPHPSPAGAAPRTERNGAQNAARKPATGPILRPALTLIVGFTLLTGIVYPLAVTGVAGTLFPHQAAGSPVVLANGRVVGSELVGQSFASLRYFWSRPSAAGEGYDAAASSGSNYGPTSAKLMERVKDDIERLRATGVEGAFPVDLVTASGSGLDPDVSPEAALIQVPRIARERDLSEEAVRRVVEQNLDRPMLGVFGQPKVNVLKLNLALDALRP
ncbi:MAG TPA: potassium-transporting ATPase subunit KdpC [Microvirga sp.]|nr:potassium-transporting ATPase subunit KdpC [Microvirga sp.]